MLRDFLNLLGALDDIDQSTSLITDGDYVNTLKLAITATAASLRTNLISLASKIDNDILYANDSGAGAPLNISAVSLSGTACTITFSSGDPTDYLAVGSKIYLAGFTTFVSGDINGAQVITSLTANTIVFNEDATGGAVNFASGTIVSNEYRSITEPDAPSTVPTNDDYIEIQDYMDLIISQLQSEPDGVIPSALQTAYISVLDITSAATVILDITIPSGVTTDHFFQIYRSALATATGTTVLTDLTPSDELQLVYEAYVTDDEISAGFVEVEDIVTDAFRGANLYTNNTTGEGILQANDVPPLAKDINLFKGSVFYANTKTKHRLSISLLGVSNMIEDYDDGTTPTFVISDGTTTNTYSFVTGRSEVTEIVCDDGASLVNTADPATYFQINSANDKTLYYVWYKVGSSTDPSAANPGRTGIQILADAGDTATQVATRTRDALARHLEDFTATSSTVTVTVTNVDPGYTTDADAGTSSFTVTATTQGRGEDVSNKEVLLSNEVSPATAVDKTARSLVKIINMNADDNVYAFYLSGADEVPGQIFLESRNLNTEEFYVLGNNSNTGSSFNPDISPTLTISNISVANPTVITTSANHGMVTGDFVMISGSNSTPSVDGLYEITKIANNTFSVQVNVTILGDEGGAIPADEALFSENETKQNRIYFSKPQQPESVPILNYLEIGSKDKAILRIFPLRDSLFVFKEDGLYRISGEEIPFTVSLFDSSTVLIAPDSLDISNNALYCWTEQGITAVTEAGPDNVGRPIDVDLLRLSSSQYTTFSTATWGVGYESDNSYLVWTVENISDELAMQCYRYGILTNSWTLWDKSNTCGVVNPVDDKLYLGSGTTNFIEKERKTFTRTDYSDEEVAYTLESGNYGGTTLVFDDVSDIEEGDIFLQEQYLTLYQFNQLLRKLDGDQGVADADYYSLLNAPDGVELRAKIADASPTAGLAAKLDADSGVAETDYLSSVETKSGTITAISTGSTVTITTSGNHELLTGRRVRLNSSNSTPSVDGVHTVTVLTDTTFTIVPTLPVTTAGTTATFITEDTDFQDMQGCFNIIIDKLNLDTGVEYSNYQRSEDTTTHEGVVTAISSANRTVTLDLALPFIVGTITLFTAINCSYTYAPLHMGDPLGFKHLREVTVLFQNKAFTSASLSFSSDLVPSTQTIDFNGTGSGIYGHQSYGSNYYGGASNEVPFRTYVPRNYQRCRFLNITFTHRTAREKFAIYGLTLTGRVGLSTRAYR
jgi:hypothetical protein